MTLRNFGLQMIIISLPAAALELRLPPPFLPRLSRYTRPLRMRWRIVSRMRGRC
jgi:hypothetical protein